MFEKFLLKAFDVRVKHILEEEKLDLFRIESKFCNWIEVKKRSLADRCTSRKIARPSSAVLFSRYILIKFSKLKIHVFHRSLYIVFSFAKIDDEKTPR